MNNSDRKFPDLLGALKSWKPWRSKPAHVSRDFWMPDQSCRVCYECDSQFTLFNRRHHCRLCGRIFCAKCTSNWVPLEPSQPEIPVEEWDIIRVCNYCFKQREQGVANGLQVASLDFSSNPPSATSFLSIKSSGTCGSSSITYMSLPHSGGFSPHQSAIMEAAIERQNVVSAMTNDHAEDMGEQKRSRDQFGFCRNRSDDNDEEFGMSHLGSTANHFSQVNGYYGNVDFDDINSDYKSCKVLPDGDADDSISMSSSPLQNIFDSQICEEVPRMVIKDVEHDIDYECEASSSLYAVDDVSAEPMDFENNGVLWLPPEPEDEEDERGALLFEVDDDYDEDAAGEWGYLYKSISSGSGESPFGDKSSEEQKITMKNVVDGHFRALVAQLLQVDNLPIEEENDKESWLEIITAFSWEAASLLKPDTSKGAQMDPGGYVKVKCLASGLRSESLMVKGIVCKKNVAHRRMTSKREKPRILILEGALEYQRVSNAFSSVDTLLQQEMDHLKMAVAKIDAHNPDILLVEKSVSRYAQDYLLAKDISLVLNIRRPLLERIARCTGAQIVPSIDHLSSDKLGYCDMFHVERFSEEHGTAGLSGKKPMKTLMYFEGCPKPLGFTILLRGARMDELKKVKHILQYGIFAAYHLALETSFLADEGATLPELPLNSPIKVVLPDTTSTIDRFLSTMPGSIVPASERTPGPQSVGEPQRSKSLPTSDLINMAVPSIDGTKCSEAYNLPDPVSFRYPDPLASSSTEGIQHYLLNEPSPYQAPDDRDLVDLALTSEAKLFEVDRVAATGHSDISSDFGDSKIKIMHSDYFDGDSNINVSDPSSLQLDGKQIVEEQPALEEEFPPRSEHQSILVSSLSRCVWKGTVCERSHLFRIKYYGSYDKPLGRFLLDHLLDQKNRCLSCEMPAEAHVLCYTHQQGNLTISAKKLPEILLPGEREGKIWMWHRCLRCPRINGFPPATRRVLMSDAAWGLSFGKFLELSFSNHVAASRVASCGHSLHRDCLRFYGFGNTVACFRYASIAVHSVHLPPPKLDFNYESQAWIESELNEVVGRAEVLFSEVLKALRLLVERKSGLDQHNSGHNISESRRQIADLEGMLQKEKSEFEESLQKILNKEAKGGQPAIDILELNRLRRQLLFQSYMWDHRLIYAASLDVKDTDDMEVTDSEPIQKRLGDTEKILDISGPVMGSSECITGEAKLELNLDHWVGDIPNNQLEEVHQRTDIFVNSDRGNQTPPALSSGTKATDESDPLVSGVTVRRALSDGQAPICLSDSLYAAWVGESEVDTSSTFGVSDMSDVEDHREELNVSKEPQSPSVLSTKDSDNMDDSVSWLGMPFVNFYRSLNKNILGSPQKLDTLAEYDSLYISSFRESELQGGPRLLLPAGVNDTVVSVYDDEPTSIISYALVTPYYFYQLSNETYRSKDTADDAGFPSYQSLDGMMSESYRNLGSGDESMIFSTSSRSSLPLDPLSMHARVSFVDDGPLGKVKYSVICYYAKRFESLRKICCPSRMDFVRSLSRCKKWGAQGGKSNVFFAKTMDERFIIKQVTRTELESFTKFAPAYFKYLSESISSGTPTCLAKVLGIYQVKSRHLKGGKETKMDVLVMENLLFRRNVTRLYDLKGSSRARYIADSSGSNKVLLDQNFIESMPTSPIFVGNKTKRQLGRAIWNDTSFLGSIDVMDYSLLVGIDEEKHELVLGIIDFMRQYTWDKHLETWVKTAGILGGPKNAAPTVISPKQYKTRFRNAMTAYFLMVPDQWPPPITTPSKSHSEFSEGNSQNAPSTTSAEMRIHDYFFGKRYKTWQFTSPHTSLLV